MAAAATSATTTEVLTEAMEIAFEAVTLLQEGCACDAFPPDNEAGETVSFNNSNDDDDKANVTKPVGWKTVPRNVWMQIVNYRPTLTQRKDRVHIVTLLSREGTSMTAWTSGFITRSMDKYIAKHALGENNRLFIKALGSYPCASNPEWSYFKVEFKHQ